MKKSFTLRLENETPYVTRDLANLFARGLAALGAQKNKVIRCISHPEPSPSDSESESSRGIAYVGSCNWRKGEKGNCETRPIVLVLPPSSQVTLRRLARLFEHELLHTFGLEHEDMSRADYWSTKSLPAWAKGCKVRTKSGEVLRAA